MNRACGRKTVNIYDCAVAARRQMLPALRLFFHATATFEASPDFRDASLDSVADNRKRVVARFFHKFGEVAGILDRRVKRPSRKFRLLGENFLGISGWFEIPHQV